MAPYHVFLYVTAQMNSSTVYTQTTEILLSYELSNEELSSVYSKSSIENSWVIWTVFYHMVFQTHASIVE